MTVVTHMLLIVAVVAGAGVYGGDLFALLVLRAALGEVDDRTLTATMGHIHKYGDRRMPVPFVIAATTSLLTVIVSLVGGRTAVAASSAIAVVALAGWLGIFLRVSAPINRAFAAAAVQDEVLLDARALQRRWDGVVPVRLALQAIAVAALCTAVALV